MNDDWRLVFDEDAFQFVLTRRLRERLLLFKTLDSLRTDPYQVGDFELADSTGRELFVRRARPFLVWSRKSASSISSSSRLSNERDSSRLFRVSAFQYFTA